MPTWPEFSPLPAITYPVTGTVDVQLQVAGTRAAPIGQGQILLRNGTVYGEPVERFSAAVDFNGGEIGLKNIELKHYEATVAGDAAYNPTSQACPIQFDRR